MVRSLPSVICAYLHETDAIRDGCSNLYEKTGELLDRDNVLAIEGQTVTTATQ
jgi:hypothetical protein